MGAVISMFDSCGPGGAATPASFMEEEYAREGRVKGVNRRKKMDVMGCAMESAMKDLKHIVGLMSDTEEMAEDDEDYLDMSMLK
jgi:hypothetical protein